MKEYASAAAFRTALETRLKNRAQEAAIDLQRLRRQVAFDRFLSRLFSASPSPWLLKGGYSMELRLEIHRTTRDIDLSLGDPRFSMKSRPDSLQTVLELLQSAASLDLQDHFTFLVGESTTILDGPAYGGARYPIESRMAGRTFVRFHVDVAAGEPGIGTPVSLLGEDWLGFAGIPPVEFSLISAEQQFAEKLHAYSFPRGARTNSRVRDLVDLVLLIDYGDLHAKLAVQALDEVFRRRGTHEIPTKLAPPPREWKKAFDAMARECGMDSDLDDAFDRLEDAIAKMNGET